MSANFPSQRIRQWDGVYTVLTDLPGVSAAEINLQAGDIAFVQPSGLAIAVPAYCVNPAFPATWVVIGYPQEYHFSGTTGAGATLYSVMGSGTSIATIAMKFPVNEDITFTSLKVQPTVNTLNVSCVFTVMKNGAATGITVTVGAGSTTLQTDGAHTASLSAGASDNFDLQTVTAAGTGSMRFSASLYGIQTSI